MTYERKQENCPKCNGWVLLDNGRFVSYRETSNLICEMCGHDYDSEDEGKGTDGIAMDG